jgi:hypothetical protein
VRSRSLALAGCALTVSACALDERFLKPTPPDGGVITDATGGPFFKDTGNVAYDASNEPTSTDTGAPPPPPTNVGCMHFRDGAADCNRTLVQNADFNSDVKGWDASGGAVLRWVEFDVQGAKGSGSLGVKTAQVGDFDGPVEGAATQCIPATAGMIYDYAASVYVKRGQVDGGQAQIEVWFYDKADCAGLVHTPAYSLGIFYATNRWMDLVGATSLLPPEGVSSMAVRLVVQKPFRSDPFEVLFDAVRVTSRKAPPNAGQM